MNMAVLKYLFFISLMSLAFNVKSQNMEEVKVWGTSVPAEYNAADTIEAVMYIYTPAKEKNNGTAIVVCPGGGYQTLAINHEGHDMAKWLASEGITAAVLRYRLPKGNCKVPISDVREATRYLRQRADELAINPNRIGVMGFSAGGHLASTHLTFLDDEASQPNFGILFYPVISSDERYWHKGSFNNLLGADATAGQLAKFSNELNVTAQTPPVIMFHSDDDRVLPINSVLFYEALKKNNVPAAMYIFPSGGHGWGFRSSFTYHEVWKGLLISWLNELKRLEK